MTVLEIEAKKAELARHILSLDDENILNKLTSLYNNLTQNYPCDFTIEEVVKACEKAIEQHEKGTTIPLSSIKRKIS